MNNGKQVLKKILALRDELRSSLKERDDEIEGLLTAVLSRQHLLLIAQKGTAKSLMIRLLASAIDGAEFYDRLLTRFSTPEEIFGAVKLSGLKNDVFERNIEGKLPTANFAFLDEIFKANSSILNSLLTLINERVYHNNGAPVECPLETLLGASNEFPEGEELDALYDRFLLKYMPAPIQEDGNFKDLLRMDDAKINTRITFDELHEAQKIVKNIEIPDAIVDAMVEIRKALKKEGIQPSDRRYRWSLSCIKAYAFLNGRTDKAVTDDMEILKHILWDEVEHIPVCNRIVIGIANPYLRMCDELYDNVMSLKKSIDELDEEKDKIAQASEVVAKSNKAKKDLYELKKKMESEGRDTQRVDGYISKTEEFIKDIAMDIMGLVETVADAIKKGD